MIKRIDIYVYFLSRIEKFTRKRRTKQLDSRSYKVCKMIFDIKSVICFLEFIKVI